jgi:2-hydroxychromene-2-carboxylate isomerase
MSGFDFGTDDTGSGDSMGEVIQLAERRARRRESPRVAVRPGAMRAEFLFDLACPFTYLAAERVDRAFEAVVWTPVSGTALRRGSLDGEGAGARRMRRAAEERAAQLRMPLVWPERFPEEVPAAMRVASLASECGRGAAFALAAGRLAYCGGFDLEDPEMLAEAAAAAGLALDEALDAARDSGRDGALESAGRRLLASGADRLPALRVGHSLFWGEERVGEAAAAARMHAAVGVR